MIDIKHLTIQFELKNPPLINQAAIHIQEGDKILLIGPSGSGKSVLLKAILGILPEKYVAAGEFYVQEKQMNYHSYCHHHAIQNRFATIFQDAVNSLHPYRQIQHQFADKTKALKKGCEQFRLQYDNIASAFSRNLSGGQCQRVSMLFPYLMSESRNILIFDEPVTDIDPISRKTILRLIKDRFLSKPDKTVLYVTHQHDELTDINFRRYVIENDNVRLGGSYETN